MSASLIEPENLMSRIARSERISLANCLARAPSFCAFEARIRMVPKQLTDAVVDRIGAITALIRL